MTRVMFSCTAGIGHFRPLVPLARAFVDAGHDVVFATAGSFAGNAEAAGFSMLAAGMNDEESVARMVPYRPELLELPPLERRAVNFSRKFATIEAPAKVDGLRAAASAWKPDLLVHDAADLAAPLVAALLGIPAANHSFGRLVPAASYEEAAAEIAALWADAGLDPPLLGGVYDGILVDICPPSLQTEPVPEGTRVEHLRPTYPADPRDALPPSILELPDRRTVYVTLGTVFNDLAVFGIVLAGLAGIDCNVIATIGRNNDPRALGAVPANVVVEQYVAQGLLLPLCAATVGHGGSGSVLAALAEGLPMVLLPQGADQFDNAQQCRELGVARMLLPAELTPEAAASSVLAVLEDASYGDRARALAAEIAAMPSAAELVPVLVDAAAARI